jgi:hypothetical protein
MTTQKDFKRLVRGRMQKTGESYTSARASLLKPRTSRTLKNVDGNGHALTPVATEVPKPAVADYARLGGMSDEKLKEKTGCTWEKWVWALDHVDAHQWPHGEIAEYVSEKYKVDGWWAQMVTVGYERIKGLRAIGQRRSGSWEASKSKTMNAPVGALFKAFKEARPRAAWLPDKVVLRATVPNKSVRMTWQDGTSVQAWFESKGRSKATVAIAHAKLDSRAAVDRMKAYWGERLDALAAQLDKRKSR